MIPLTRHSQKDKTIDGKHVVDTWGLGSPGDRLKDALWGANSILYLDYGGPYTTMDVC